MVSAAKLRRAQRRCSRRGVRAQDDGGAERASRRARSRAAKNPLLQERGGDRILLVVVTGRQGSVRRPSTPSHRTAVRFLAQPHHQAR